jgi:hypothetical protein
MRVIGDAAFGAAARRKLIERRKIPSYSDGRGCKVWLRRSELDAYMEANRA